MSALALCSSVVAWKRPSHHEPRDRAYRPAAPREAGARDLPGGDRQSEQILEEGGRRPEVEHGFAQDDGE